MIIVLSYNFWTKDTWFALAELAFLRWLYIVLMDLVLAHCIRTFEGCDIFYVRSQFVSDAYAL